MTNDLVPNDNIMTTCSLKPPQYLDSEDIRVPLLAPDNHIETKDLAIPASYCF